MKSLEELKKIRVQNENKVNLRSESSAQIRVLVGLATCGIASGARPVLNALAKAVQDDGMSDKISVTPTGCIGLCQYEPIVEVVEQGKERVTYIEMTPEKAMEVYNHHLKKGQVVTKYTLNTIQI